MNKFFCYFCGKKTGRIVVVDDKDVCMTCNYELYTKEKNKISKAINKFVKWKK